MNEKHKPDTHYIYGLIDPATNQLRYIGQTVNPKARLSAHVCSPNSKVANRWILDLKRLGKRILELTP